MGLLESIQGDVRRLAARVGAPEQLLPTYERSEDFARPHIEVADDGLMAWVVVERGQELERRSTLDRDELLYLVFTAVTFSLAADYEVAHRIENEDSRRLLFSHQLELLRTLSPRWEIRHARELGPLLDEVGLS